MSLLHFRGARPTQFYDASLGNQAVAGIQYFRQDTGRTGVCQRADNVGDSFSFRVDEFDLIQGQTDRARSELQSSVKLPFGVPLWFAHSTRNFINLLDTPWDDDVINQFHQTEGPIDASGYPPFEENVGPGSFINGRYFATLRVFTATNPTRDDPNFYPRTTRASVPYELGAWHDTVGCVVFGWQNDASLHLWLDGVPIVAVDNISIGMNDELGPYHKFGSYWHPLTPGRVMTSQNLNVVPPGLLDLSSRITNPPRINVAG